MPKKSTTYKKFTINLVLIALFLCILFGNGLHLHSVFNHFSDHGDIHVNLHAHSSDYSHTAEKSHLETSDSQHKVSFSKLSGVLTPSIKSGLTVTSIAFIDDANNLFLLKDLQVNLFTRPPPKNFSQQGYFLSFSYRGPPTS